MSYIVTAIILDEEDALKIFNELGKNKNIEIVTMKGRGSDEKRISNNQKTNYVCDKCLENKRKGILNTRTNKFICNDCLRIPRRKELKDIAKRIAKDKKDWILKPQGANK